MLTEAVDEEVFEHLKDNTIALLPTPEVLEQLYKLYSHNFDDKLPAHKRHSFLKVSPSNESMHSLAHFMKVLPFKEYTYKILPPIPPQPEALHIQGSVYSAPFENLPSIRSKLHPCFVFRKVGLYDIKRRHTRGAAPLDETTVARIAVIFFASGGCVEKSWLGPPETWPKYSMRSLVINRPDATAPSSSSLKKNTPNVNSARKEAISKAGAKKRLGKTKKAESRSREPVQK